MPRYVMVPTNTNYETSTGAVTVPSASEPRLIPLAKPKPITDRLTEARALEKSGDAENAIHAYTGMIRDLTANTRMDLLPTVMFNMGNCYREIGKPDAAESCFQLAIALDTQDERVHYNLGHLLQSLGRFEEAIGAYRNALHISPTFGRAHFQLGRCLNSTGRPEEANKHWRRCLQYDSGEPWATIAAQQLH